MPFIIIENDKNNKPIIVSDYKNNSSIINDNEFFYFRYACKIISK